MQSLGIATKVIAASLALSAFAIAIIAGLVAGNPARTILFNAVVCMILCQLLGMFIGVIAERAVTEHLAAYKSANPVPDAASATSAPPRAPNEKKLTSG